MIDILFDTENQLLEKQFAPDFLALNCTPIVNIFSESSEPICISHQKSEYPLLTRLNHHPTATEIYSVEEISAYSHHQKGEEIFFYPIYKPLSDIHYFYHPVRQANSPSEIYLAFSTNFPELFYQQEWIATAKILCTNRHLVSHLPYGGNLPHLSFIENSYQSSMSHIKLLIPFSDSHDISHNHEDIIQRLLRYFFIYQSPRNLLNLQNTFELLKSQNKNQHQLIKAVTHLDYKFTQKRIHLKKNGNENRKEKEKENKIAYSVIHGTDIYIQINPDYISQSHIFFFCAVLERYFEFQAGINSYTCLVLVNCQGEEIYRWPLRCGV